MADDGLLRARWAAELFHLVWGPPPVRLPDAATVGDARRIASERTGYWPESWR